MEGDAYREPGDAAAHGKLVHPTGRKRLVPKVEPETGEADGIGYAYHAS